MDIVARGDGRMNANDLHVHVAGPTGHGRLIDLSRARFLDPGWLVTVAAVTERAVDEGRAVTFAAPEASLGNGCANYLARMRLPQHLDRLGIAHTLPTVREHPQGDRLSELQRFDSEDEFDALAATVQRTFEAQSPDLARALYRSVHEIASNVLEHSGRTGGYLALQRFDGSSEVAFAVADSGVGLRARLSERNNVPDDRSAIVQAAKTHVTSHDVPGHGRGIGRVIDIAGRHSGSVLLASGTSQGVFQRGHIDPRLDNLAAPLPGTLAQARLHRADSVS